MQTSVLDYHNLNAVSIYLRTASTNNLQVIFKYVFKYIIINSHYKCFFKQKELTKLTNPLTVIFCL